ncbi:ATP-binding cassette sub-family A member 6-like [Marmota marmota marmota]|uniref:ATP-binding cassette sub-family A member 6-like n=1 Tax=Marmota marmota marmota TaxID=9994 RepID=UPI0020920ECA|nr:ATP-binding cassette sub-family A member 6-like [Marmota marmota marmota]
MRIKQTSVYQQTQALLCKNFLKKWRMKRESALEWGLPILLGLYVGLLSEVKENNQLPEIPPQDLGRVDKFNVSSIMIVYTPVSNITQQIMNTTAFAPLMKGTRIIGVPNEKDMDDVIFQNFPHAVGITFSDTFSYKLKFFQGYAVPFLRDDLTGHCWEIYGEYSCVLSKYWERGFVTLQSIINAAIIEVTTNHSVIDELMSVTAINMKTLPFISKDIFQSEMFILYCLLYFSPFIYFVSHNVTKERKKSKELMKMMGLHDSAFWLSWGLMYTAFILVLSIVITIIITSTQVILMTGFMVIFTLLFLYGLSLLALSFLMSVLLQKAVLTNLFVFLLTLFWGFVGFTAFYKQLPPSVQWILSICSPFAFRVGMTQILHLDYNLNGVVFPDPSEKSYTMLATFSVLAFDGLIYLMLALYFDKILPHGNEHRYSPLFFLSSSSCFRHRRTDNTVIEKDLDPEHPSDGYFEPIASEFQGKEAIRIRNVKKEYKTKSGQVKALKGMLFDIYEGQITAILGHSGAGKSSLLNILNGLSVPTEGSVTIYNKNLSEMQDLEEIRKITGVCPQNNVQIDMLTVKENLSLFAKIKGIRPQEVEQEVQQILLELDMQNIQDNLAIHLSDGQKRMLTFGIAILGDPQVLLLDEPTAGLDPFSRHQVWTFLKERRANRVILFSTQSMEEADILADRKVIMSNGELKCAGSSVFLKRKWGLGYHLSLYKNEISDPEQITSFINHHISDAKLKLENKEKLVFTLPLESTSKFPGNLNMITKKASSQLWISGLYPSAYWCGQAVVDVNLFNLILLLMYLIICITNKMGISVTSQGIFAMVVVSLGYSASLIFLTYVISFIFRKRRKNSGLWSFCFYVVLTVMPYIILVSDFNITVIIVSMVLLPSSTLEVFLLFLSKRAQEYHEEFQEFKFHLSAVDLLVCLIVRGSYYLTTYSFEWLSFTITIGLVELLRLALNSQSSCLSLLNCWNYRHAPPHLAETLTFDMSLTSGEPHVTFQFFYRISPQIQNVPLNPEIHVDEDEDEDVQAERMRASSALTTSNVNENPVIIASCLHKEYAGQRKSCFSKRKKKIAARNISFCVKKGEVLGLLGPNGAGKSSSIRMIAGITKPTGGQVELRVGECKSFLGQQGDGMVKFLGYCPQENVLWPTLTMKEHLEVYATVKGLQKEDAAIVISRLVNAFNLYEQLNVPVQKLASGTTKKLCFVLSILGNSPILLLDEPSTGIDPTGQQQIWQTIQAAVKNTEKSVLLTTHYLAEAEALCDRVAIMVSGRLRCIGSIQHLKRKFGKDYILELKVKEPSQVPLIHTEILNLFPQAAQQERFSSLLTFKLPIADVYPLSQAFYKLETVKHNFNLEEYTLSQCTLEKVFLELFSRPELGNVDEEVDTTMRWKLLSYSDEP